MDFVRSREEDFFCRQSAKSTTLRGTFFYYADDDSTRDFLFFFFSFIFEHRGGGKKQSKEAKGEIVGGRILLLFSLDAIPRIDLTDLSLSLSLSFGTKLFGREEEEEEEERDDDAGRRPLPRFRHRADGESRGDQEGV